MKLLPLVRGLAALALTAAALLPARAEVVTFEDVLPTIFQGTSITSGNYTFTSDAFGFSGVDNASSFSAFANAPANAAGQFLFALNSDGIFMTQNDGGAFYLTGLDASFIAPFGGLGAGILPGLLGIFTAAGSEIFEFGPSDANGNFNFQTFTTSFLSTVAITEAYIFSCIFQTDGTCSSDPFLAVPAQFALDNIRIPEPGSVSLVLLALGLVAASRRRRIG
jgi:hypothetical protein